MISLTDIGWAAGFLEGEGSFRFDKSPRVQASQVEIAPLEKLQRLFGGTIKLRKPGLNKLSDRQIYHWDIGARRSAAVMMTLYMLMSPKRQSQILHALDQWKQTKNMRQRDDTHCLHGHLLEGDNIYWHNNHKRCATCKYKRPPHSRSVPEWRL